METNDITLFLVGLETPLSDSIYSLVNAVDEEGNQLNYKAISSKDKSDLYLVDKDFDSTNAPESVDSFANAQDFSINPPVPDDWEDDEPGIDDDDDDNNEDNKPVNPGTSDNDNNSDNEGNNKDDDNNGNKKGLCKGAIIGIVVAIVVVVIVVIVVLVVILIRRR